MAYLRGEKYLDKNSASLSGRLLTINQICKKDLNILRNNKEQITISKETNTYILSPFPKDSLR